MPITTSDFVNLDRPLIRRQLSGVAVSRSCAAPSPLRTAEPGRTWLGRTAASVGIATILGACSAVSVLRAAHSTGARFRCATHWAAAILRARSAVSPLGAAKSRGTRTAGIATADRVVTIRLTGAAPAPFRAAQAARARFCCATAAVVVPGGYDGCLDGAR